MCRPLLLYLLPVRLSQGCWLLLFMHYLLLLLFLLLLLLLLLLMYTA
jgi:hypothetical protein